MSEPDDNNPQTSDTAYLARLVRTHDRARYYASLFAPADKRGGLHAIYAMNAEICRIPGTVSEPGLGEIRLQWWQDAVRETGHDTGGQTPVMRGVADAMRSFALPPDALAHLVEAHRDDLYGDPWATLQDMEAYFGQTESALFQLASIVLGSDGAQTADAAGHAGIAYGLSRQLAAFSQLRRQGRQIASSDLMAVYSLDPQAIYADKPAKGFEALAGHLADLAAQHLSSARAAIAGIPSDCRPAFLPLAIVRGLLRQIARDPAQLWQTPVALSDFSMLARISRAGIFGL